MNRRFFTVGLGAKDVRGGFKEDCAAPALGRADLTILEQAQAIGSIDPVKDLALFARQERLYRADFG